MVPDVGISSFSLFKWRQVLYLFNKASSKSQTLGHGTFSPREISHCLYGDIKTVLDILLQNISWGGGGTFSKSSGAVGFFLLFIYDFQLDIRFQLGARGPSAEAGPHSPVQRPTQSEEMLNMHHDRHPDSRFFKRSLNNNYNITAQKKKRKLFTTHLQLKHSNKSVCGTNELKTSMVLICGGPNEGVWFTWSTRGTLTAAITPNESVSAQTSISGPLGAVGGL